MTNEMNNDQTPPESDEITQVVRRPLSDRKPWTVRSIVLGLMAMLVLALLVRMWHDLNSLEKSVASVKTDVATIQTNDATKDVDKLQKQMSVLEKKVNGVVTATDALIGNVNALTDKVVALTGDVATKADKTALDSKAERSELSGLATRTRRQLVRVEDKLDTYILVEAAKETIPLANGEPQPTDNGTVTVIVRPIPVDDE